MAVLALLYFTPAVFEGRELFQHDVAGASGTAQDVRDYYTETGEVSYWTNSLFGGMPMYQIAPSYPSIAPVKWLQDLLTLQQPFNLLPSYSWLLFAMLLGFFIFMRSLRVRALPAFFGAIMWCFSSYFIILIDAGHIWKLMTLAFIPPTIAGLVWAYRGQYLKGGIVAAFFASLQIMSNHIQMSYYFAFLMGFLVIGFLVEAIRQGQLKRWLIATGTMIAAGAIAIAINGSTLYHTYQYTQQTMRGGSALASPTQAKSGGGLDKDYITQWSYGKAETWTLLVPNAFGGASGRLLDNTDALQSLSAIERSQLEGLEQFWGAQLRQPLSHYWGDQPFTSGPVYVGAFVLFLFILGCFIVRGPIKWALLAGTILSLLLSWGHNLMWFTDLFIDYVPLYNKFRTVSSILVIAEFTMPALAVLALLEFVKEPSGLLRRATPLVVASVATLGVATLIALMPGTTFSLVSEWEQEIFRQLVGQPGFSEALSALKSMRADIVRSDAIRSIVVLLSSLTLCFLYYREKLNSTVLFASLSVITLLDLWTVDKRYLNDERFIDARIVEQMAHPVTPANQLIAQDKDPHYRVLNLNLSTFNDATTSYQHRSAGGYHAAKLSRYQDLIEHHLSRLGNSERPINPDILNMLDIRYLILPAKEQGGAPQVETNPNTFGAAWFVDSVVVARDANEEIQLLGALNLRHKAVIEESEAKGLDLRSLEADSTHAASVSLDLYKPNRASYTTQTDKSRLLVLSDIYYPDGWKLHIDGVEAPILRVNYLLRGIVVPQGSHRLELVFDPDSIHTTEFISRLAQILLLLATLAWIGLAIRRSAAEEA